MKSILIIDTLCPEPYDSKTLQERGLGGTEASVVRIAEGLSKNADVTVVQPTREHTALHTHVTYAPLTHDLLGRDWHAVVVVRDSRRALDIKEQIPQTPVWVWLHDLVAPNFLKYVTPLAERSVGVVVVSDFHRRQLLSICALDPLLPALPRIERIYNPIDDDLQPDNTPIDKNKLLFISSPHKGLHSTLKGLEEVRRFNPDFELWVSDPGYADWSSISAATPHVKQLGTLSHRENIQQMRGALALFYLNHSQPETFGLAIAESNALGIPVLTHPFGAAPEVVCSPDELVNTHDVNAVAQRLMRWYNGQRPPVRGNDAFRLVTVIRQWNTILGVNDDT